MILQLFSASCVRNPEAAIRGVLKKRLLLKNSQYSQENTCVGVFLILPHRCFSVNIVKFSRTPNLKKHLRTTASVNSRTVLFQESIALSFKQSALTSGICNLGELVQQTQVQTGSRGFYLPSSPEFSKFRAENTCFVFSNLRSFYFSLFCAQNLVKTFSKWKYIFSFSILKWHVNVQTNRNNKLLFKDEHSYN